MIGLVLVSHSARLAEGVLELVEQMVQGAVPLALAGGTDIPAAPIGPASSLALRCDSHDMPSGQGAVSE